MHQYIFKYIKFALFASLLIQVGCLNYQNRWSQAGLGLTLAQVENGVVIKEIAPTFADDQAALQTGDFIVEVDNIDVSTWPKDAILEAISGPAGGLVSITVLRKKQMLKFDIERIIQKNANKKVLHSQKRKIDAPELLSSGNTDTSNNSNTAAGNWSASTKKEALSDTKNNIASTKDRENTSTVENEDTEQTAAESTATDASKNINDTDNELNTRTVDTPLSNQDTETTATP